jgi:hypothetical protein
VISRHEVVLTFRTIHKAIGLYVNAIKGEPHQDQISSCFNADDPHTLNVDSREQLALSTSDEGVSSRLQVLADRVGSLGDHAELFEAPNDVLGDGGSHSGGPPAGEG